MPIPGDLLDVANIIDPETVSQQNVDIAKRMLWMKEPTYVSGAPNTVFGKPTTGTHVLNEIWVDKYLAKFICTVAGTPGTWVQIEPAVVSGQPAAPGAAQDLYWIVDRTNATTKYRQQYWNNGGSAWVNIF
jgi:hypothetical protein